jgi:hypothetical protein
MVTRAPEQREGVSAMTIKTTDAIIPALQISKTG